METDVAFAGVDLPLDVTLPGLTLFVTVFLDCCYCACAVFKFVAFCAAFDWLYEASLFNLFATD